MTDQAHDTGEAVGYGRPPVHHQFKKGQSGNPAGRKKGARSHSEIIAAAMSERVTVKIDGRSKTMTKLQAALTQQANKAAGGDRHATKALMSLLFLSEDRETARASDAPMNAQELYASDAVGLDLLRKYAASLETEATHDLAS